MKTYTLPVIGIMTLGAAAFANTTPSKASTGDVLLARDSFSTCQWLGDRFNGSMPNGTTRIPTFRNSTSPCACSTAWTGSTRTAKAA